MRRREPRDYWRGATGAGPGVYVGAGGEGTDGVYADGAVPASAAGAGAAVG
jgi:hypothetical protein